MAIAIWPIGLLFKDWVGDKISREKRKASVKANVTAYDKLGEK